MSSDSFKLNSFV